MSSRPTAEEERVAVQKTFDDATPMKAGDVWFVVSARWFNTWKSYSKFGTPAAAAADSSKASSSSSSPNPEGASRPGPIDNTDILAKQPARPPVCALPAPQTSASDETDFGVEMKEKLHGAYDYEVVPAAAWALLSGWYGVCGPVLRRYAVEEGSMNRAVVRVETYPVRVRAQVTNERGDVNPTAEEDVVVSKKATVAALKKRLCTHWAVADPAKSRLHSIGGRTHKHFKDESQTLEQLCVADGAKLLLEVQLASGEWPKAALDKKLPAPPKKRRSFWRAFFNLLIGPLDIEDEDDPVESDPPSPPGTHKPGLCGLHNLGNTCFMNSALQCLSNTGPLCMYFASGTFKKDVNPKNAMGMKGQLAEQFGKLVEAMWSGSYTTVSPRSLKTTIGKWAPQFSGYSQHDSQELLAFLLDGLHEDLNEISKKPFVEVPEGGTRPDLEVADDAWAGHKKRNRSLIVETFQGQLKSTLVCPDCGKTSITFDPFMYLSLPLPTERDRAIEIVLFKYNTDLDTFPVKYGIKIAKRAKIEELKAQLSPLCGVPVSEMHAANSYCNKIYAYLPNDLTVASINDADINLVYQIPPHDPKATIRIHAIHRRARPPAEIAAATTSYGRCPWQLMGLPFVLQLPTGTTGATVHAEIWSRIKRHLGPIATQPPFTPTTPPAPSSDPTPPKDTTPPKDSASEKDKDTGDSSSTKTGDEGEDSKGSHRSGKHKHRHHQKHRKEGETKEGETKPEEAAMAEGQKGDKPAETKTEKEPTPEATPPKQTAESPKLQHEAHSFDPTTGQEYPFKVSLVSSTGLSCAKCPYSSDCYGCTMACDNTPQDWASMIKWASTVTLAVDWCPACSAACAKLEPNVSSVIIHQSCSTLRAETARSISLDDCMRLFSSNEQLGPEDPWWCPGCKTHKQAFKKFDLFRLPRILVVHLKRFQYSRLFREKLSTDVEFPTDVWDLTKFVPPQQTPPLYRLYAVSNHMGGLGGGHYTAFARNRNDGKWYLFNDSSCQEVGARDVRGNSAYVLFYERIDQAIPLPSSPTPPAATPPKDDRGKEPDASK